MASRRCPSCGQDLELSPSNFHTSKSRPNGLASTCKACACARSRDWSRAVRLEVLTHYSGGRPPACVCCGETQLPFLALDHINGGGAKDRLAVGGGSTFYAWVKRTSFPTGFQVLCHNCNMAKAFYDGCPHGLL